MQVYFRFRDLEPSDALRLHAVRGIHFHLGRFAHEIRAVHVRFSDVNGPKGGPDKECQITVLGRSFATVLVEDLSGDAYSSLDIAADRAGRVVGRDIERAREARAMGVQRRAS